MELGCHGVLMNTAIAHARDPVLMARGDARGRARGSQGVPRRAHAAAPVRERVEPAPTGLVTAAARRAGHRMIARLRCAAPLAALALRSRAAAVPPRHRRGALLGRRARRRLVGSRAAVPRPATTRRRRAARCEFLVERYPSSRYAPAAREQLGAASGPRDGGLGGAPPTRARVSRSLASSRSPTPRFGDDVIVRCVEAVAAALPAGAFCVQLRDKQRARAEPAHDRVPPADRDRARAGAWLVINGNARLARDVGADGVHLGGGAGSVGRGAFGARASGPGSRSPRTPDDDVRRAVDDGADAVLASS